MKSIYLSGTMAAASVLAACSGSRPAVLYAHGSATVKSYNLGNSRAMKFASP